MRVLIVAVAMAAVASVAGAQGMGSAIPVGKVFQPMPTPSVPKGAREQAEDVIRHTLGDPDSAKFRAVRSVEVASIRHNAFEEPINGPVSVVCGQFSAKDAKGGDGAYTWFFVAIKRKQLLWSLSDDASGAAGDAYYSCKNAGVAD